MKKGSSVLRCETKLVHGLVSSFRTISTMVRSSSLLTHNLMCTRKEKQRFRQKRESKYIIFGLCSIFFVKD